jgi:hypothetical protein
LGEVQKKTRKFILWRGTEVTSAIGVPEKTAANELAQMTGKRAIWNICFAGNFLKSHWFFPNCFNDKDAPRMSKRRGILKDFFA